MKIKADYSNDPVWKELSIKSRLPEELKCLDELAHNMWWALRESGTQPRDVARTIELRP